MATPRAGGAHPEQPAATPVELTPDGLPRRVRQANLARQLRDNEDPPAPAEPWSDRSPEQVRDMMSALQAGTVRGRRAADREGDA